MKSKDRERQLWLKACKRKAEIAMELAHRSGGGLISTKCPFVPRHSIVFYSGDIEVAGLHICFSCGDSVSLPSYYLPGEADPRRGVDGLDFHASHDELMAKWQHFFFLVGAEFYEEDDARP